MAQFFSVHNVNPQSRLIRQTVEIIRNGGVIAYPTDSSYALGCSIGNKQAMERIRKIRKISNQHELTVICKDLSELSLYAKVDNNIYRLLKRFTPGPYTFILAATREVPRRLQNPKRKTIGLRVPDSPIIQMIIEVLEEPLMSSTLIMPDEQLPMNDACDIRDRLEHLVDLVIDGGPCDAEPTSVIEFLDGIPRVIRHGKGNTSAFEQVSSL